MSGSSARPPLDGSPKDGGDWFPWRMFVEAAGVACQLPVLLLALGGLAASELGVAAVAWIGPGAAESFLLPGIAGAPRLDLLELSGAGGAGQRGFYSGFVEPFAAAPVVGWWGAVAGAWRLLVWSLFGCAVARVAVMRLTHNDPVDAAGGLRWSAGTVLLRCGLLLGLVALIFVLCGVVWLLGWASAAPVAGLVIDLLLPVVFVLAALAALLALGVVIGWPLMTVAAGVEHPDPFDAASRGVAYAYQRPLRRAVYLGLGWLVGVAAGAIAQMLVQTMLVVASLWLEAYGGEPSSIAAFWWAVAVRLPMVYHAGYFWCAATVVYLLLRRDIDEQQADEVFLPERNGRVATGAEDAPAR